MEGEAFSIGRTAMDPQHLHAIVDMGSNGIRFSITSLAPPQARILPTLYQHRAAISLYDAQYPAAAHGVRQPIDDKIIIMVVAALQRFQRVCMDFGVSNANVTVLATEATRTAVNSEEFCMRIQEATGWTVTLLSKAEEGRVGAMGILSSLPDVRGLVMDLGGGSTQLSVLGETGDNASGGQAVSLPYGAAALMRRLGEAQSSAGGLDGLREEVREKIKEALETLGVTTSSTNVSTLYLSGGGFRGWGYVLMSRHRVQPYPITAINGFRASRREFLGTQDVTMAAAAALRDEDEEIFRVSDRRASQVPAVAFLINVLAEAIPQVEEVRFCQGGVREGYLFSSLPADVTIQRPLIVATQPFQTSSSGKIANLLANSLPKSESRHTRTKAQDLFPPDLLRAFGNLLYYHSTHSTDLQASAALRSTTSGILAGVHGLLHESRALLALLLCARWGGEVPPTDSHFKAGLEKLIDCPWTLWWIQYLGAVAALVANVHPAGIVSSDEQNPRLRLQGQWLEGEKANPSVLLQVGFASHEEGKFWEKEVSRIEKVGKKKRWIGGREGVGCKVIVKVYSIGHAP